MMEKKIRVLTISKPYVCAAYREKFRILAQHPRLEIGLIVPEIWDHQRFEPSKNDNYWLTQLPIVLNGKNHFFFFKGLKKAILDFKPDLLNVEEEHYSAVTFQCYRIAKSLGIKTLFYTWQNIYKDYPAPFSWIENYIFKHTTTAVAGNQEAKGVLRKKGFRGPIAVIPQMGAYFRQKADEKGDHHLFDTLGIPRERFVISYAGRFVEEKGIQDFLSAMALLKNTKAFALIIGSGPFEAQLKEQANKLQLENQVRFVGSVSSSEIYSIFRQSQALCLPSLTRSNWKEQFGRVLIEAMAEGTIPIGSDSGEIPHVIDDCGRVFPEGDPTALSKAISELMNLSQDDLNLLSQKARERVRLHFTHEVISEKFAQVFVNSVSKV